MGADHLWAGGNEIPAAERRPRLVTFVTARPLRIATNAAVDSASPDQHDLSTSFFRHRTPGLSQDQ